MIQIQSPLRAGAVLLKERHEQCRRQADELPTGKQGFDRAGQRRDDHAQDEDRIQHKEPVVARLAVHVTTGERADRAREHQRQDRHRNRQPIEHQLQ